VARRSSAPLETVTGRIDALNSDGWGVVRAAAGGKTVFVAGALPGELVEYRVRRRERNHDQAELVTLLETAPDRIAPRCAHFGLCGGCALQHLAPESQLAVKERELREALRRIGKVEPASWLSPLSGAPWAYRRRARLGARFGLEGMDLVRYRPDERQFGTFLELEQRAEAERQRRERQRTERLVERALGADPNTTG